MKKSFQVIIELKGAAFKAHCPEVPGLEGHGRDKEEALESIRAAIRQKFGGGSGSPENEKPKD
jgi:predicted RNase H-like HicB family nuclease